MNKAQCKDYIYTSEFTDYIAPFHLTSFVCVVTYTLHCYRQASLLFWSGHHHHPRCSQRCSGSGSDACFLTVRP